MLMVIVWAEYVPTQLRPNLKGVEDKDHYTLLKYREMFDVRDLDILFVGSSHAYRTFDTRIWKDRGYHVYNMGTSSQTHIHTGLLLREFVPKTKPRLVIYEVYPDIFSNEGIESNSIFLAYGICKDGMTKVALKSGNIKSVNELIHAKYRSLVRPNEVLPIVADTSIEVYRSQGFIEIKDGSYKNIIQHTSSNIKSPQLNAFINNLRYLDELDIPVILVYAPVTSSESGRFIDQKKYEKIMSEYDNYIDFSQLDFLVDSLHFYDYHHLNQDGVELFNPYFIDWIEAHNIADFKTN